MIVAASEGIHLAASYTQQDINAEFDGYGERPIGWSPARGNIWLREFPSYEAINIWPVAWRMNVYADAATWAILFEEIGVEEYEGYARNTVRGVGPGAIRDPDPPYTKVHFFNPIDLVDTHDTSVFVESSDDKTDIIGWVVRPGVRSLPVRGKELGITSTDEELRRAGIVQEHPPVLQVHELFRMIEHDYPGAFFADPARLRSCLSGDLPLLLRLDEWFHPNPSAVAPSECETFQMISQVILTGDPSHYRPTLPPNTHWSVRPVVGV